MLFCPGNTQLEEITCCQTDLCNGPLIFTIVNQTTISATTKTKSLTRTPATTKKANSQECSLSATYVNGTYTFLNTTCPLIANIDSYCYVSRKFIVTIFI